jgi:uncharacterized membrane protein YbhN (UPF0104 family)
MASPERPWSILWYILPCYYLSSWAAYLSLVAPSGIGVTEGVLAYLLKTKVTPFEAAFMVMNFRLALILADVAFAAPLLLRCALRRVRKGRMRENQMENPLANG